MLLDFIDNIVKNSKKKRRILKKLIITIILVSLSTLFVNCEGGILTTLVDCGIDLKNFGLELDYWLVLIEKNPTSWYLDGVTNQYFCKKPNKGCVVRYLQPRDYVNIFEKKHSCSSINFNNKLLENLEQMWKYQKNSKEEIASYLQNWKVFYINTSSSLLNEEIDQYEWFTILKAEMDTSGEIPIDLAVKYGREYMGGLINHKINTSRQLYYRGLTQDIKFSVPLSGIMGDVDNGVNFHISENFKITDWEKIRENAKRREVYAEYNLVGLEGDYNSFSDIDLKTITDSLGFQNKLKYAIDSDGRQLVSVDKNPNSIQEFLTWRDTSADFDKENWVTLWNTNQNQINILPDNLLNQSTNNKRDSVNNVFNSLMTDNTQELLGKNSFFFKRNVTNEELKYVKTDNSVGMHEIFNITRLNTEEAKELESILSVFKEEIKFISKNIEQRLTGSGDIDILETKYKKATSLTLTGNAILDFFIFLLRNPLLDFSYINTTGLHYDTLDKFWDKRPSTTKWIWADIAGFSPLGGYTVKEANKLVDLDWEVNSIKKEPVHRYFKKIQLGSIPEGFLIDQLAGYFGKSINKILEVSQKKINKIITLEFITESKKIQKQNVSVGGENSKKIIKKALNLDFKNFDYLSKLKLNSDYIQQMDLRTLNLLKNLANQQSWAQFAGDNVSYIQLGDHFKNKTKITREQLKKVF